MCSETPSLAPTMTPATAGRSRIERIATAAMPTPVLAGDPRDGGKQLLEQRPAAPGIDHLLVFAQRGRVQLGSAGLGAPEIFFGQQAAENRAVGQQSDAVLAAPRRHAPVGTPIDERILHLVRDDRDAVFGDDPRAARCRNWSGRDGGCGPPRADRRGGAARRDSAGRRNPTSGIAADRDAPRPCGAARPRPLPRRRALSSGRGGGPIS